MEHHWHQENASRGRRIAHRVRWLFECDEICPDLGAGIAQHIQIGEFEDFGRGLVIDGRAQLAEAVDPAYTRALVYPALLSLPVELRKNVLIIGGGDGAAAREVLRFSGVRRVIVADISRLVVEKTRELIPSFWGEAPRDHRLTVVYGDAFRYLRESGETFNVIISDLTDPADASHFAEKRTAASDGLYTTAAMDLLWSRLADDGVVVFQAQELSNIEMANHVRFRNLVRRTFAHTWSYRELIEFWGYWQSFILAVKFPPKTWEILAKSTLPFGASVAGSPNEILKITDYCRSLFVLPPELCAALRG